MKKVIAVMALVTCSAIYGAASLFQLIPNTIGTAVIAEKGDKSVGGQAAVLLPTTMSAKQGQLMNVAYDIAKADGHKPELVQSIILQETGAGSMKVYKVANPGPDAYFGIMQIKLSAAKDVLSRFPALYSKYDLQTKTDDEIKANLIMNEKFNIAVGSKYLLILKEQYGFTGRTLMNAFNRGPGGVKNVDDSFHYALGAEAKLASWKSKGR